MPKIRWECPNGRHPAVLSSTRPHKNSIVRYCLDCSKSSGFLVERVAPVLERKREARKRVLELAAARKRAKAAADKEKAKAAETARYTVEGVDLREELKKLLKLKAWNVYNRTGRPLTMPELMISRRTSGMPTRLGYAEPVRWRITVATWPGQTLADARETLVHELTHLVVGGNQKDHRWHGQEFKDTMRKAFKEAYKVDPAGLPGNTYHGRYAAALRKKEQK